MLTADLLRAVLEGALRGVFVGLPGTVTAYDPSTSRATVQPGTKRLKAPTAPGQAPTYETLPPRPSVPVLWLGGGGYGAHAPLHEGDQVLLVCCDYDPNSFLRTGQVVAPDDPREHDLANAVAIAGFGAPAHAESNAMTLGHPDAPVRLTAQRMEVDGNSQSVALAAKIDAIAQAVAVIPTAASTAASAAGAVNAVIAAFAAQFPLGAGSVASAKIKTGG